MMVNNNFPCLQTRSCYREDQMSIPGTATSPSYNFPLYVSTQDELLQKILYETKTTRTEIASLRREVRSLNDQVNSPSVQGHEINKSQQANETQLFEVHYKVSDTKTFELNKAKFISNLKEDVAFRNKFVSLKKCLLQI